MRKKTENIKQTNKTINTHHNKEINYLFAINLVYNIRRRQRVLRKAVFALIQYNIYTTIRQLFTKRNQFFFQVCHLII